MRWTALAPVMRVLLTRLNGARAMLPALLAALQLAATPAWAQSALPSPSSSQPAASAAVGPDALSQASAAVVGVRVTAAEGARSTATLGVERVGSGVVISPEGLVLTIGYLILEAQDVRIITQDNRILPAVTVAYDLATGFGLIRPLLPWLNPPTAPLGSGTALKPGEPLMAAVGATETGEDPDVSLTQLVSQRPFSGAWEYHIDSALFTSPPVMAGSGNHSGAALFNQRGELVGIGSLLVMDAAGGNRRLPGNMFVPVDLLRPILAEMQQSGSSHLSRRAWLGLNCADQGGRIRILRVNEGGPAEEAGLKAGDVVLAVNGEKVSALEAFYKKLWALATPETPVHLTVLQGADLKTVVVQPRNRLQSLKKPAGI